MSRINNVLALTVLITLFPSFCHSFSEGTFFYTHEAEKIASWIDLLQSRYFLKGENCIVAVQDGGYQWKTAREKHHEVWSRIPTEYVTINAGQVALDYIHIIPTYLIPYSPKALIFDKGRCTILIDLMGDVPVSGEKAGLFLEQAPEAIILTAAFWVNVTAVNNTDTDSAASAAPFDYDKDLNLNIPLISLSEFDEVQIIDKCGASNLTLFLNYVPMLHKKVQD